MLPWKGLSWTSTLPVALGKMIPGNMCKTNWWHDIWELAVTKSKPRRVSSNPPLLEPTLSGKNSSFLPNVKVRRLSMLYTLLYCCRSKRGTTYCPHGKEGMVFYLRLARITFGLSFIGWPRDNLKRSVMGSQNSKDISADNRKDTIHRVL